MKLLPYTAVVDAIDGVANRIPRGNYGVGFGDACNAILAAINALPSATEWQPIETAPKRGTVLLYRPGHTNSTAVCWWSATFSEWTIEESGLASFHGATHWQPLPTSPETCQDKELT